MDKRALVHSPGGGRHLVSDTGLAIVCRDLSQLFLAEEGEKESVQKRKRKKGREKERKERRKSERERERKKESPQILCIWKVQKASLISPQELEQIWKELYNVVGSL